VAEHKGLPIMDFADRAAWERWLAAHGETSAGIWLRLARKSAGVATVARDEAIEAALAHGWIDGQLDRFDADFWLVRFTPRGARSKWSERNRATAERLVAEGRMAPAGLRQVELAKADGRWAAAYAPQSRMEVPPDFAAALGRNPKAEAFFATLKGANRYATLYRIHDAKTEKTRAARIEKFVGMLERGETLHPKR
jgi:uncharacterized protein YdeI (YjbR/CyaY-like superfamily)